MAIQKWAHLFGVEVREGFCVSAPMGCGEKILGFKDSISRDEYRITGMCQKCQDEFEEHAEALENEAEEGEAPF